MFRKSVIASAVFIALFSAVAIGQQSLKPLATSLPAEQTVVYVEMDVSKTLSVLQKTANYIDRESAQRLIYQVRDLYDLGRKLARRHQFQPMLLDRIQECKLYFLLMADEPQNYVPALVIQARDASATVDLVQHVKSLLKRLQEKHPDAEQFNWKEVEVDRGEMIKVAGQGVLGRLGPYVVMASERPRRLWGALISSASAPVSGTPLYQRLTRGRNEPHWKAVVNIEALVKRLGTSLENELKAAQEQVEQESGQQGFSMGRFRLQWARMAKKAFDFSKSLFSLDKLHRAGMGGAVQVSQDGVTSNSTLLLSHGRPLSETMNEILDGSGSFKVPDTGPNEAVAVFCRVNLARIYENVLSELEKMDASSAQSVRAMMQMMKARVGVSVDDVMSFLASDFYMFVTMEARKITSVLPAPPSSGSGETSVETQMIISPKVTAIWGVTDPGAARETLSTLFTKLAGDPQMSQSVSKRTYQETDVYCFGTNIADSNNYPNGVSSFALAVVDRYLTVGSWDRVTELIRQIRSPQRQVDARLARVVEQNSDANLLVVMPEEFQQHMREELAKLSTSQTQVFDMLLNFLQDAEFDVGDPELSSQLKDNVTKLTKAARDFYEEYQKVGGSAVMTGKHRRDFYVIDSRSKMQKD